MQKMSQTKNGEKGKGDVWFSCLDQLDSSILQSTTISKHCPSRENRKEALCQIN